MSAGDAPEQESEWERRRRLAAVFGDVLPDQTRDDLASEEGAGRSGAERGGKGDEWYRDQVPPHHG